MLLKNQEKIAGEKKQPHGQGNNANTQQAYRTAQFGNKQDEMIMWFQCFGVSLKCFLGSDICQGDGSKLSREKQCTFLRLVGSLCKAWKIFLIYCTVSRSYPVVENWKMKLCFVSRCNVFVLRISAGARQNTVVIWWIFLKNYNYING